MKRIKKILVRFTAFLLGLVLLFILCVFLFKDSLLAKAQKSLSNQLNTDIEVSKLEISPFSSFPLVGISANKISIQGTENEALLLADRFEVSVNPMDFFSDKIQISKFFIADGIIKIKRDLSGNFSYELNENGSEESSSNLDFPSIEMRNIHILYDDKKDKVYAQVLLEEYAGQLQIAEQDLVLEGKGVLKIDSLMSQSQNYNYEQDLNFELQIVKENENLDIKKCKIDDTKNSFEVSGILNDLMEVESEISIREKDYLPSFIDTTYLGLLPQEFKITGNHSGTIKRPIQKVVLKGKGVNLSASFKNDMLRIDGDYTLPKAYNYLPAIMIEKGKFKFSNFVCDPSSPDLLKNIEGSMSGKNVLIVKDSLQAELNVKEVNFTRDSLTIEELKIKTGNTDVAFNGHLRLDLKTPEVEGRLYSKVTNSEDITAWLYSDVETTNQDDLVNAELTLSIEELRIGNWKSKVVKNNIRLQDNQITYAADVETCEGHFSVKGKGDIESTYNLQSEIEFDKIDVNKLLTQFDNFGQEMVTDKNLFGKIKGAVILDFVIDESGTINPHKSTAKIVLNATEGKLIGLQLLQDFSTYVNAKELANVEFESMTNYFEWKNNRLQVPVLYIKNNAANFLISGYHDYNNRFAYNLQLNAGEVIAKKLGKKNKAKRKGWWNMYYHVHGYPNDFKVDSNKDLVQRNIESSFLDKENIFFELIKTFGYNDMLDQIDEWEDIPEYYDNN